MILVDEAAFIPLDMFWEVIVPLIGMETSTLAMISTPVDTYNFFSQLMNLHDENGLPVFHNIRMRVACNRCISLKRVTSCTHKLKDLPPWKSRDKQKLMNMIMHDQQTTLARENYGIISDEGESYISSEAVDKWLSQERFVPAVGQCASIVILTMDPNGGDSPTASEQAIVSIALLYRVRVVSFRDSNTHTHDIGGSHIPHKGIYCGIFVSSFQKVSTQFG